MKDFFFKLGGVTFFLCLSIDLFSQVSCSNSLLLSMECAKKIVFDDLAKTNRLNSVSGNIFQDDDTFSAEDVMINNIERRVLSEGIVLFRINANISNFTRRSIKEDQSGEYIFMQGVNGARFSNGRYYKISGFISSDLYYAYKMIWNGHIKVMMHDLVTSKYWTKKELKSIETFLISDMQSFDADFPIYSAILKLFLPEKFMYQARPLMTIPDIARSSIH